jgi:hypothetical protein
MVRNVNGRQRDPMRQSLFALLAVIGAGTPTLAAADWSEDYARVNCVDDIIVVQFTTAPNAEQPVFEPLPARFGVALSSALTSDSPALCAQRDGTRVRLMQGDLGDATAYGANTGWSTPVVTLWIGERIALRALPTRVRGYPAPPDLRSLVIVGSEATTCDETGACTTAPIAFSNGADLRRPGRLTIKSVRRRDVRLCHALVRAVERPRSDSPADTWPTFLHDRRDEIAGDNWNGTWNEPGDHFDLNNDGRIDYPIEGSGFGGRGFNYGFWALPPGDVDEPTRERIANALSTAGYEDEISRLRREGWLVFTGAETRFGDIDWVYLDVVLRRDRTYLLAHRWRGRTQVLLSPEADGDMREVCVFERAPEF